MIDLNQVNIIDNLLPLKFQDYLYNDITKYSSWNLVGLNIGTTFFDKEHKNIQVQDNSNIENSIQESFQFSKLSLQNTKNYLEPDTYSHTLLLHYLLIELNYQYKLIPIKVRTNLQTPIPSSNKNHFNTPHIDLSFPTPPFSYTLVYYVMDSDGDTIVFNEKYKGFPNKNFSINKKITPKKGRIVMFPSSHFHCGSHPATSPARIVINYNFQLIPL